MLKGLGQKIKMYRNKKNLTQHAFSNAIEISPNYLSALERDVKVPKLETFVRIANKMQQNREIDNKNAVYIWGKSAYHSCKRLELLDKIYELKVKRI